MYYREWDISLDTADTGFKPTRILTSSVAHLAVLLVQPLRCPWWAREFRGCFFFFNRPLNGSFKSKFHASIDMYNCVPYLELIRTVILARKLDRRVK